MGRIEEDYVDVLQNIEFGIVSTYWELPGLSDHDVMRTLDSLIDEYRGEQIGRPPRDLGFSLDERQCRQAVREICEWRLGRATPKSASLAKTMVGLPPNTVDEIILCLRRIHKSAKGWNKAGGSRGYLDFVVKYVK